MARKLKVDFTDVEEYVKCEEGQHVAVLKEIEEKPTKESGNDMLVAKFEVVSGNSKGAIVYNNFVLVEAALWRLKVFLEAVSIKVDGKIAIDLDKLIGRKCIIEVSHEDYNGQTRARIEGFKPLKGKVQEADDEDDEDEDDEEEQPKKKGKKVDKKPAKKPAKDEDDEDDDEEEEEEKPNKKDKKSKKPAKKKPPVEDDDDDDDDDWED